MPCLHTAPLTRPRRGHHLEHLIRQGRHGKPLSVSMPVPIIPPCLWSSRGRHHHRLPRSRPRTRASHTNHQTCPCRRCIAAAFAWPCRSSHMVSVPVMPSVLDAAVVVVVRPPSPSPSPGHHHHHDPRATRLRHLSRETGVGQPVDVPCPLPSRCSLTIAAVSVCT